jgi:hypothetical protein
VKPTRIRDLVAVLVVVGFGMWLLADTLYRRLPAFPPSAPVSLFLIAVFEGYTSVAIRARLDGRPRTKPIMPIIVARYAALAKASSVAGAIAAGVWAGFLVYAALHRNEVRTAGRDILVSALGALAGVLLVVAALRLEGACRVRRPPEPPPSMKLES